MKSTHTSPNIGRVMGAPFSVGIGDGGIEDGTLLQTEGVGRLEGYKLFQPDSCY